MITRNAFLGEDLDPETIAKIEKAIGNRWELRKGQGWTDEYYICIGSFDPDHIEIDCHTEANIDLFENKLKKILDNINVTYEIAQY